MRDQPTRGFLVDERDGTRHALPDEALVFVGWGKAAHIEIRAPGLDRKHLVLRRQGQGWLALSHATTNGTVLLESGRMLLWNHGLQSGDRLRLGDGEHAVIVRYEGPPGPVTTPPAPEAAVPGKSQPGKSQPSPVAGGHRADAAVEASHHAGQAPTSFARMHRVPPGPPESSEWGLACDLSQSPGLFISRADEAGFVTAHPPGSGPSLRANRLFIDISTMGQSDRAYLFRSAWPARFERSDRIGPAPSHRLIVAIVAAPPDIGWELSFKVPAFEGPVPRTDGNAIDVGALPRMQEILHGLYLLAPSGERVPALPDTKHDPA